MRGQNLPVPKKLEEITAVLNAPLYIVGGYCRNYFLNPQNPAPTDIDLAGSFSLEELKEKLGEKNVLEVNKKLGTALLCGEYEYTAFRTENYKKGGAHSPDSANFGATLAEDAKRRDFTCNAVYFNILNGEFIDPADGIRDIADRVVRTVSEDTFSSDGLRLMRLSRQAAELDFSVSPQTETLAAANIENLRDISAERVRKELNLILLADTKYGVQGAQYNGLKLLYKSGALGVIIPELLDCAGCAQNPKYHKYDVLGHIFETVRLAPPRVELRLAALLHDISKPACMRIYGNMYKHAELGAETSRAILTRLKYPNAVIKRVTGIIAGHMFDKNGETRENKARKWIAQNADIVEDLIDFSLADGKATGRPQEKTSKITKIYAEMKQNGIPLSVTELAVNGKDVMRIIPAARGTEVGKILDELLKLCLEGRLKNERVTLIAHLEKIKDKKEA